MTAPLPHYVFLCGGGGLGKTTFAYPLLAAAGVDPDVGLAETSTPIVFFAEQARLHILDVLDTGDLLTAEAVDLVMAPALEWLALATGDHYQIPTDAFRPDQLDKAQRDALRQVFADVVANRAGYHQPVTVENKSTLYRALLSATSVPTLYAAKAWLSDQGQDVSNIWVDYALFTLDVHLQDNPGLPLQICSGARMPGDDQYARARNGLLLEVIRPGFGVQKLVTEERHFIPDGVIVNNGTLDDLAQLAQEVWHRIQSGREYWPVQGSATPYYAAGVRIL
jgi:hypothetical protein